MSSYIPPLEDLPIFNPSVFTNGETEGITLSEADARYVKKSGSIMTGQLTVPDVSITNSLTLNSIDVETKLNEIDTNIEDIATNTSAISALQTKTTDLTYSSGTDTSTFSGKLTAEDEITIDKSYGHAILNIKAGPTSSFDSYLKLFSGGDYQGGMYTQDANTMIINSFGPSSGNIPPIEFRHEYYDSVFDVLISTNSLVLNEDDITVYNDIIPITNGSKDLGSSSRYWNKLYSEDIQTSNHTSIDTSITNIDTSITNIDTSISNLDSRLTTAESNITSNDTDISTLQNITQFQSSSGSGASSKTSFTNAQTEIKSNYTTYLLIKGDEDNSSSTEGAYLQFYTGTAFQGELGSDRNSLILKSYSSSSVKPIYIKFVENGSITYTAVEFNELNSIFNNNVIPNITSSNTLGSTTKYWNHAYINNISTSSYSDLNSTLGGIATNSSAIATNTSNISTNASAISTLEDKTQYISVSGNEMYFSNQSILHENNNSVYFVLNGDKNNTNSSLGSYLTLYAHNVFNGYLGTIGTFIDLHSFSSGTVKPIKFTFQDSVGTHTSLSCDDEDITFSINLLPSANNTYSIGASGNIFSTSYFDNIITSSHNVNTAINTLEDNTQAISYTTQTEIDSDLYVSGSNIWLRGVGDNTSPRLRLHNNGSSSYIDWEPGSLVFRYDTTNKFILDITNATFNTNIIASGNNTMDLGSTTRYWKKGYINDIQTTSHTSIDTDITNLETITQYQSINGSETKFTSPMLYTYSTQDTSIDWGRINDRRLAVSAFIPKIRFYEGVRDMYIGTVRESIGTARGVGIAVQAGGGNVPNMCVYFCSDMTAYFYGRIVGSNIQPSNDNQFDVGSSSYRYDDIYATNQFIQTSDLNEKNSIETLDETEMKDFIKSLNPVKYKFNNKTRYHTGLIAQEVKEVMPFDWGVYINDEETQRKALRYGELISPMISTIQYLLKENENLKSENQNIKNRLDIIEQLLGIE